jgi:hypothetical protein
VSPFLRVDWVAVPKALRARRVNSGSSLVRTASNLRQTFRKDGVELMKQVKQSISVGDMDMDKWEMEKAFQTLLSLKEGYDNARNDANTKEVHPPLSRFLPGQTHSRLRRPCSQSWLRFSYLFIRCISGSDHASPPPPRPAATAAMGRTS